MAITQDYVKWTTGNDYKGATFTDGAFTVADMTLTKAGAFAASKANHWLYLTDNGSNEITDGYYRIASVTSANAVVLAASPKSGANDPTDVKCTQHDGTTSLPWRSDQGAVDLCTRNTTDGNQVNISDAAAVVHTVALDLTTFIAGGILNNAAPLILRGYTSAANDGGMGEIDCGGATMWAATNYSFLIMVDLEMHTFGNNNGIYFTNGYGIQIIGCEVHKGASSPASKQLISLGYPYCAVVGCYVHDTGSTGIGIYMNGDSALISGNYVTGFDNTGISLGNCDGASVYGNICLASATGVTGISVSGTSSMWIIGNIVYNTTAGTAEGINLGNSAGRYAGACVNNIAVGWSGAGGLGIGSDAAGVFSYMVGYNAFYNNTSNFSITDTVFIDETANDVALSADPFTDAANGDFSLTAAAKTALAAKGFPTAYLGAHASTVPNLNIGPIQLAASSGGGRPAFGDRSGGKF